MKLTIQNRTVYAIQSLKNTHIIKDARTQEFPTNKAQFYPLILSTALAPVQRNFPLLYLRLSDNDFSGKEEMQPSKEVSTAKAPLQEGAGGTVRGTTADPAPAEGIEDSGFSGVPTGRVLASATVISPGHLTAGVGGASGPHLPHASN